MPNNTSYRVKYAQKSVWTYFQSSRTALKKVMNEKKIFWFFDYNFFQWPPRALKPLPTASLAQSTPEYVVSMHSIVIRNKIFNFPKISTKIRKKNFSPQPKILKKNFFRIFYSKPIFSKNSDHFISESVLGFFLASQEKKLRGGRKDKPRTQVW